MLQSPIVLAHISLCNKGRRMLISLLAATIKALQEQPGWPRRIACRGACCASDEVEADGTIACDCNGPVPAGGGGLL